MRDKEKFDTSLLFETVKWLGEYEQNKTCGMCGVGLFQPQFPSLYLDKYVCKACHEKEVKRKGLGL